MQNYTLHLGDNLATLKNYPDNHFDSIVTDPPYGIEFLGKDWDKDTGSLELYKECLRVLKPGGYLLAFSAARTYHQLATTIEKAGFEIRDQLMWLYSSGFPKAQDIGKAIDKRNGLAHDYVDYHNDQEDTRAVSNTASSKNRHCKDCGKQLGVSFIVCEKGNECRVTNPPIQSEWQGYKTALKPAHEPIVMARKPFKGSTIDNVLKNGLGAMNIDATRVPWADEQDAEQIQNAFANDRVEELYGRDGGPSFQGTEKKKKDTLREWRERYPNEQSKENVHYNLNPELQGTAKKKKSDAPGVKKGGGIQNYNPENTGEKYNNGFIESEVNDGGRYPSNVIGEVKEGYQKYFYCPKVSRRERHVGFESSETWEEALKSVGGYRVDEQGNPTEEFTNTVFIPGIGIMQAHGVAHEVEKIRKAQGLTGTLTEIAEAKGCTKIGGNLWKLPDGNTCADNGLRWNLEKLFGPIPGLNVGNNHPTVKPVALMEYLIKLVTPPSTPELQRKVLDPFNGSGSTGMAATKLGHYYVGCELDQKYIDISKTRIDAWNKPDEIVKEDKELPPELFGE